jgi:hypothetical protein
MAGAKLVAAELDNMASDVLSKSFKHQKKPRSETHGQIPTTVPISAELLKQGAADASRSVFIPHRAGHALAVILEGADRVGDEAGGEGVAAVGRVVDDGRGGGHAAVVAVVGAAVGLLLEAHWRARLGRLRRVDAHAAVVEAGARALWLLVGVGAAKLALGPAQAVEGRGRGGAGHVGRGVAAGRAADRPALLLGRRHLPGRLGPAHVAVGDVVGLEAGAVARVAAEDVVGRVGLGAKVVVATERRKGGIVELAVADAVRRSRRLAAVRSLFGPGVLRLVRCSVAVDVEAAEAGGEVVGRGRVLLVGRLLGVRRAVLRLNRRFLRVGADEGGFAGFAEAAGVAAVRGGAGERGDGLREAKKIVSGKETGRRPCGLVRKAYSKCGVRSRLGGGRRLLPGRRLGFRHFVRGLAGLEGRADGTNLRPPWERGSKPPDPCRAVLQLQASGSLGSKCVSEAVAA